VCFRKYRSKGLAKPRTWTDSDIGIASEDRSRIFGSLAQMSDSRNWSSTRDGFVRSVSTSSSSSISSTASGMNASLTEAQSYSREARRAEELANRLESQASFFEGNSAAGSLNLSQAYREWGLVEIERNRDFYGNVRFDDLTFQLSPEGQALQGKVHRKLRGTAARRDRGQARTDARTANLAPFGHRTRICRGRAQIGGGVSGNVPQVDPGTIHDEVLRAQDAGRQRIRGSRSRLDTVTRGAQGASAESADEVKEW
jgi:conjugal transfer mating pair stabilization protein TraG